ncbi:hypothetical protein [Dyadobacter sp.]|uniref:hypothetical protein n=1 Tax=Dyadobacter sp. TaxID=1914288 RepID=UPI003F728674
MRTVLTILIILISSYVALSQSIFSNTKKINKMARRSAKKELLRSVTSDEWMSKFEAYSLIATLKFIPVISMVLTPEAVKYDSSKKIIDYLEPHISFPFEFAILLRNNRFHGTLDCFNKINFASCKVCNYDDSMEEKEYHYNFEVKRTLSILSKRKYKLLFTVKYFRSSIWFVENNRIFLFDTREKKFYDPDEYIKDHCSVEKVRQMAAEKPIQFCY